ncbi:PGF-CTERM-anchored ABC transporter substrate-binding protein [Halobellus ruber]|uniref:ABC transporter substrate-binding protein n=1 Tax=Halobellus ruber TaxID=2761102 RepID=A0A7J9SH31_9EURY|nr:PGF-CTERM-anchored ABC transporter substrate-binding protein [Halobellus ruber]MBB6646250.1 ABC transporter substrate-binding protein [Halobellus ruber]
MQRYALLLSLLLVVAAFAPAIGGVAAVSPAADHVAPGDDEAFGATAPDRQSAVQADACSFPYVATDATGTEVTIDADPERIVTLNPSAAQTMWEIGAEDEVVGVSQYASYLEGTDATENVSGPSGPSVEEVIGADPDLVLVPSSSYGAAEDRVEQLRAQGIPVYVFGPGTSLEFVANKTELIGRLTGNCEAGAERAAEMRQSVALMEQALDDEERPVGLNVFFGYTSGANTFIGDVMGTGGLRNGAAAANISGFKPINDEVVVTLDPEWIVVPENSPVPETPAYNSTTAVQEGNVVVVDTNYLQQPAPRAVIAAETIMQAVHPEAYDEYRQLQAQADADSITTTPPPETTTATQTPDSPATTATGTPGFGASVSVVAVAALVMLLARRQ